MLQYSSDFTAAELQQYQTQVCNLNSLENLMDIDTSTLSATITFSDYLTFDEAVDYIKQYDLDVEQMQLRALDEEGTRFTMMSRLDLGYDKTYDAFYESAELPFFKKRAEALKDGDTRKKVTNSVLEGNSTSFRENEEYKTASFRIGENSSLGKSLANDVPNNSHLEETLQRQKQLSFSTDEDSSHNTNILPLLWMKKKIGIIYCPLYLLAHTFIIINLVKVK